MAGTVAGVFRSIDGGEHWAEISPAASSEVHEVESVAVDPVDTNTIYAGTWHLPWKTTDGGAHWSNIKEGLIDDSDVFSIIIDPHAPGRRVRLAPAPVSIRANQREHSSTRYRVFPRQLGVHAS